MDAITRRSMLIAMGSSLATAGMSKTTPGKPDIRLIPYVDGLCLLGDDKERKDIPLCGLHAVTFDVSTGEMVKLADGTQAFRRTYTACQNSIQEAIGYITKELPGGRVALRGEDIPIRTGSGGLACVLQMQGCDWVEQDLSRLAKMHSLGLRIAQFTHHYGNSLAGGCMDLPPTGLTPFGRDCLREMERIGLIPDLAHASDQTGLDVIKNCKRPVIVSHGACKSIVRNARCTSDEVIRGVAKSGGVMGVFMMSFWLTNDPRPTTEHLIAQIRRIIQLGGIECVGISNDYPVGGETTLREVGNDNAKGIGNYLPWWKSMRKRGVEGFDVTPQHVVIPELNNPKRLSLIHDSLERAKFRPSEIEKIMGANWIRVFRECLG